jgi:acetylornithine deacetylase/succinyl-diaminopimelate desuccinylase-like protein
MTIANASLLSEIIDRVFESDVVPELARYTEIPCLSPSFDPDWAANGAIGEAASLLVAWCKSREVSGVAIEIVEIDGLTPVIFAEIAPTDPARAASTTLIYGHLDKQPPLGNWREGLSAFTPVREGDRLYGRGTADDGYATFAAFSALEALEKTGGSHGRIVMLIEASEESGSPDLTAYLDALAGRIGTPSLVICLDSGCATYDRLWVTTSLRGVLVGSLRVDVLEEGVHSGHAGGIVPSSFRLARQLLSRLEDETTGEILLAELNTEIPPHRRAEIRQVADEIGPDAAGFFPTVPGLVLTGSDIADRIERGTWRPALALTGADGIPAVREGGNVLRAFTELKFSIRLPPNCDAETARGAIARVLSENPPDGARVTVHFEQPGQGWDAPATESWLADALEEASLAYFGAPPRLMGLGGSIPFMAELGLRYPGTQFVATGVLGPESNAHGPNEFLHIPTAKALTACVAHVLRVSP